MEILLSVMLHSYLDTDLWKIFTELSYFSRQLCAKQVSKMMIQKFEKEILILVCKMKKVFLSGWFNAMQYFLVHLSGKVRLEDLYNLGGCIVKKENWKNLELQCATKQWWRGVLQRHSRVKRL
jgi:hypothetical protein